MAAQRSRRFCAYRNLRAYVDGIERAHGEIVIWAGVGHRVNSVREAVALVEHIKTADDALSHR